MALDSDQIGSTHFGKLEGEMPQVEGTELDEITRDGVDGVAYIDMGQRSPPFEMQGWVLANSMTEVNNCRTAYAALKGTIVSIVIEGTTYNDIAVLGVRIMRPKPLSVMVGGVNRSGTFSPYDGQSGYMLESAWLLRYVGT